MGNGNIKSDRSEASALYKALGQQSVPVTAFKWSMGHSLCSSGLLDTVLATQSLKERTIPGIANLKQLAKGCEH